MSLTSYRAAPPRVTSGPIQAIGIQNRGGAVWQAWQRPTLPRLKTQYHRRRGFSRPSSGWDRVFCPSLWPPGRPDRPFICYRAPSGRKASMQRDRVCLRMRGVAASVRSFLILAAECGTQTRHRAISTGQLHALPRFHLRPINVVVYHGSRRDLVLRRISRLDAFSGYSVRT